MKRYLGADAYVQARDPRLAAKARELTAGARDSWEAARRLSAWVAGHIKGAIPGGLTARGTYDQGAGDCRGHSFLLAALCRSVGIPARRLGMQYVPHQGGAFGQHVWNEVYMGAAGWIPLDTTTSEIDYVDSGHIRIGVFGSAATSMNVRSVEILAYRFAGPASGARRAGTREVRPSRPTRVACWPPGPASKIVISSRTFARHRSSNDTSSSDMLGPSPTMGAPRR